VASTKKADHLAMIGLKSREGTPNLCRNLALPVTLESDGTIEEEL
jgi:hypothetical protein